MSQQGPILVVSSGEPSSVAAALSSGMFPVIETNWPEAAHALEQRAGKSPVAKQMIVQEVQMTSRQALDLGERGIDGLGIEGPPAFEERLLVTEVAHVRAAPRNHDRVRHQVQVPLDQVAPDGRKRRQRPLAGNIAR